MSRYESSSAVLALRRTAPVGIIVSTGRRYVVQCVCSATESCCNAYPVTERVHSFRRAHNQSCRELFDGLRASAWIERALIAA